MICFNNINVTSKFIFIKYRVKEIFYLLKLINYAIIAKLKYVTSNQDMVLISSSPTQADAKSTLFNLGENLTRTAELHVKLRL